MSEIKHTPGPWEPATSGGNIYGIRGRVGGGTWRNIINWNGIAAAKSVESQANAKLILAAPDLLAALKAIYTACDNAEDHLSVQDIMALCEPAIEKAEGRS